MVVWNTETREGKPTKVPYHPSGRRASSTDARSWVSYDEALEASDRSDGIGFVFSEDDPYIGLDFDHCVVDGELDQYVKYSIKHLNSYTEISPSGTGIHTIVRGRLNGRANRTSKTPWHGSFEVYDRGRYFTMTGRKLKAAPNKITERQEYLDDVLHVLLPEPEPLPGPPADVIRITPDDDDLLDKARSAKNGAKFSALFDRGDTTGYGSRSEADLALVTEIAFWTGPDYVRIDEWFRRSALMRAKWNREDYRKRTIDRALERRSEFYRPPRIVARERPVERLLVPQNLSTLLTTKPKPIDWLHEPYIPKKRRIWGFGPTESAKSIWAMWVATKLSLMGLRVIYISEENPIDEDHRRLYRLRPDPEFFVFFSGSGINLLEPSYVAELLEIADGSVLVTFDTLTAVWLGDETDNSAIAHLDSTVLLPLLRIGAGSLTLHHTGHPQAFVNRSGVSAGRGASAMGQKADVVLNFKAKAAESEFSITMSKGRGVRKPEPQAFRVIDTDDDALDIESIGSDLSLKVPAVAEKMVKVVETAGMLTTRALHEALKGEAGQEIRQDAMRQLAEEIPPRVRCAYEPVETDKGLRRAKVWRPANDEGQVEIDF